MSIDLTKLEGWIIGSWRLNGFLGVRRGKAFYLATGENQSTQLLMEIAPETSPNFFESVSLAYSFSHENLLKVHDYGRTELDGSSLSYAVLDLPEDDLGEMLARTSLNQAEAFRISLAARSALDYLHENGVCHGAVLPDNVYIVGGEVKLSVDALMPAEETCKQAEVRRLASMFASKPVAKPEAPARTAAARPRRLLYGVGAAIAGVAVLAAILSTKHAQAPNKELGGAAPQHSADQVAPAPQRSADRAAPPRRPSAEGIVPAPTAHNSATPAAARVQNARPKPNGSWAVIAASYSSFAAAEKRAEQMHRRWPLWPVHVSPAEGHGKIYFVVLNAGLTQDAAERLQHVARAEGAPRDTYATKLVED